MEVTDFSGVASAPVGPSGLGHAPWLIPMAADGLSEESQPGWESDSLSSPPRPGISRGF